MKRCEMIVSSIVKLKIHVVNDINSNEQARVSVERVRYIYNDVLEHLKETLREITDLQMRLF